MLNFSHAIKVFIYSFFCLNLSQIEKTFFAQVVADDEEIES